MKAEQIIALAERFRARAQRAAKNGNFDIAADYRLGSVYLKRLAAIAVASEAQFAADHAEQVRLGSEAMELWRHAHG
jgi:hypothetical protein